MNRLIIIPPPPVVAPLRAFRSLRYLLLRKMGPVARSLNPLQWFDARGKEEFFERSNGDGKGNGGRWKFPLLVLFLAGAILGVGAGYGHMRFGSTAAALSAMRGDSLLVDHPLKSVDGVRPGSRVALHYTLTNVSIRPIRILGAKTSCTCTVMENLPVTLAASESKSLTATITTREDEPEIAGSIRLYTDDLNSPEIILGYSLHCVPFSHK